MYDRALAVKCTAGIARLLGSASKHTFGAAILKSAVVHSTLVVPSLSAAMAELLAFLKSVGKSPKQDDYLAPIMEVCFTLYLGMVIVVPLCLSLQALAAGDVTSPEDLAELPVGGHF